MIALAPQNDFPAPSNHRLDKNFGPFATEGSELSKGLFDFGLSSDINLHCTKITLVRKVRGIDFHSHRALGGLPKLKGFSLCLDEGVGRD